MCCLRAGFFFSPIFYFFFSSTRVVKAIFCLPEARGQHTSATVYEAWWLRASRVSGARPPSTQLSLARCAARTTGHSSPTGCPALTPSRALKDALSGGVKAPPGWRLAWIKQTEAANEGALGSTEAYRRWETSSHFSGCFPLFVQQSVKLKPPQGT